MQPVNTAAGPLQGGRATAATAAVAPVCKRQPRPLLSQHQLFVAFDMQVERVCKELGLPRQAILAALKELPPPDQ